MLNFQRLWEGSQERRVLVPIAISAVVGILASVTTQAAPWGPVDVAQTPQEWLDNCLIYVTEGVDVPGPFEIFGDPQALGFFPYRSDVCTLGTAMIGGNAQRATVPVEATKQVDVAVVSPTINLKRGVGNQRVRLQQRRWRQPQHRLRHLHQSMSRAAGCESVGDPATSPSVLPFPSITPGATDIVVKTGSPSPCPVPASMGESCCTPVRSWSSQPPATTTFCPSRPEPTKPAPISSSTPWGSTLRPRSTSSWAIAPASIEAGTRLLKVFVEGGDGWVIDGQPRLAFTHRGDGYFNACYVYSPNGWQSWPRASRSTMAPSRPNPSARVFSRTRPPPRFGLVGQAARPSVPGPLAPLPAVQCDFRDPDTSDDQHCECDGPGGGPDLGTPTQTAANAAIAQDTMGPQMTYGDNGSFNGSPITPTGGPPTYAFAHCRRSLPAPPKA